MFKCEKCGTDSVLGERPTRVVIATRKREYPEFRRANGTHDRGGVGREIVQEVIVHDACAVEVRAMIAAAEAEARAAIVAPVVYASDSTSSHSPFNGVSVS